MAKLFGGKKKFSTEGKKEMDDFEVIPAGEWVRIAIVESGSKENTNGTGNVYSLKTKVQDGKYKGRIIFINLNLEHENEDTVERAERELASICKACGKTGIEDTEELHGIVFEGLTKIQKANHGYPERNSFSKYKRDGEAAASGPSNPAKGGNKGAPEPKKRPVLKM